MKHSNRPILSVVTTLYCSGEYVVPFYERISKSLAEITHEYELILVNDGSPDDSVTKAVQLHEQDRRVVVVDLSRNFGQHKASMTGMMLARGEYVLLIEIDLEEQPEWITEFYSKLLERKDVDVIYGVQRKRKGGWIERLTGHMFYKCFNLLSDVKIPENHITARLMTRRYVEALVSYRDKALFIGGIYELVGFKQLPVFVTKLNYSKTTYSFRKKMTLMIDAITCFSSFPLTLIFWLGLVLFLFSLVGDAIVVINWLVYAISPGWTSVVVSVWTVGGALMLSVGVLGMYLRRTFEEVKDRPYTVIRRLYRGDLS